jgi:SAM-dependent methyltransferase
MSEIENQKEFWNREAENFDAIYSHRKGRFANLLDRIFRWDMYERYRYTLESAEPIAGRTFLDVGCGSGRYALEFARRGAKKVTGIDIAPSMIQICKERAQKEGLTDRTRFFQGNPLGFHLAEKVDVTVGIGLFDYIGDPLPLLARMRDVTKGKTIVTFPRTGTWRAPIRKLRLTLKRCPVYFYSRERIDELLRRAGFKGYEITKIGQLHCVTAFPG